MSSFSKTIIAALSFGFVVFIISSASLGDEIGEVLGGLFESDPYPQEYQGGQYNENEYWVYIQPQDDITTPEMIAGRSQKGDIIDIIPTSRGKGGYSQSKDFLVIKVKGLTQTDIDKMLTQYEEGEVDEKTQLAERKNYIALDTFKKDNDISLKTGTISTALDASSIILTEKTQADISAMNEKARFFAKTQWLKNVAIQIIKPAKAATTNTYYVDPDAAAGGDGTTNALSGANCAFQSLVIWEAARNADITLATGSDSIEKVIADSNSETHTEDVWTGSIQGWTTGRENYIDIQGAEYPSAAWSDSMYRVGYLNTNFGVNEEYVRFSKLQMEGTGANANGQGSLSIAPVAGGSEFFVSYCFIRNAVTATYWERVLSFGDADIASTTVWNTVLHQRGTLNNSNDAGMISIGYAYNYMANVTVYGGYYGLRHGGSTAGSQVYWVNNIVTDTSSLDFSGVAGPTYTWDYNSSQDATADDKGVYQNLTGQTFSFTAAATSDFTLLSTDTGALNLGVDMSATSTNPFSDDITGTTRAGVWDRGADEYVAPPAADLNSHPIYLNGDVIFGGDVILN